MRKITNISTVAFLFVHLIVLLERQKKNRTSKKKETKHPKQCVVFIQKIKVYQTYRNFDRSRYL